jgi:hypothetical protein
MIAAAFLTLAAVLALADILGPGHDFSATEAALVLFLFCRWLGPVGWNRLLTAALWLSVGIAAMAVGQVIINSGVRAWGPFNSPNYLGAYAVLMFWLAVATLRLKERSRQSRSYWAAAANLLSLALSQSRGALLALGAGLFVLHFGRKIYIFYTAAIGAAVLLIRPGNEEARIGLWRLGWQIAQQRLALGWGQGFINVGGLNHFYSIPLDLLIWGGIPAVIAGAWLLVAAWRSAPDYRPFLAAWFVQGLFISGIPATWIPFVAVLGYRASEYRDESDRACRVDDHHPPLDGRVRPDRADRAHGGGDGAERSKGIAAREGEFAVVGKAHPVEDIAIDVGDDAARIDRAGDRRGYSHHAKRQRAAEKEAGEAGTDRGAGHVVSSRVDRL